MKKPCKGDPVPNPEIAPQKNSGIQGGLHDTCARWNKKTICRDTRGRKRHNGVDIKNPQGAPIFAIYDGIARLATQYKNGIAKRYAESHVHVKAQENGADVDPLNHFKTKIDPSTGKVTNPCN